jgi:cyclopropane-fatty-acyl-phospholipid synthase
MTERDSDPLSIASRTGRRRWRPSPWLRALLAVGPRWHVGSITMVLPDGSMRRFQGTEPGPDARIVVHDDRMAKRMITGGTLGFCEAYLDGDWSSPDMMALFEGALRNERALGEHLYGKSWFRLVQWALHHRRRPNTKAGSRKNIAHHYDLGNDFYARWLDRSMTYSSAVYAGGTSDLSEAQEAKYAALCHRLRLEPGMRVLEIGCGWGGFAEHAARHHGVHVTGLTISAEQHAYATQRIAKAGLSDRVEIRMQDYRDVEGRFDRVASIEMFEAVGERYWGTFFDTVRDRLVAGGRAALQVIVIADRYFEGYRRGADYIQKYIFPGGMLPSPTALRAAAERAGLGVEEMEGYASDYSRTLQEWNRRFQAAWPDIAAMGFDQRFKRMWEQYLIYCAAGFETDCIDVVQVSLAKG